MKNNKFYVDATKYNILIVEDSISIIKIINNIFSTIGFKTFLSTTLKDARDIIKEMLRRMNLATQTHKHLAS